MDYKKGKRDVMEPRWLNQYEFLPKGTQYPGHIYTFKALKTQV